ncbi:FMN-dependent NADH-azoreductase [Vreelandella malpeensis]|uniref:FMN dependent NADH:quinone oxidoreductase n=1 Tax=Vreelandella malpeensis TaxID=1172368 RepID=A0ABS8DUW6_9GAMM|nr:NAD(P)H-dependent oxidoreductase [Halomonas malpeensis]MCB8890048.1 NAD(P)H-dependent oxidoreductase [Halomonas malpeensis]
MTHLLHLDASARPGIAGVDHRGSLSRQLSSEFSCEWLARRPQDTRTYRDIGQHPPSFIDHGWIAAAFTPYHQRDAGMKAALEESDRLVDELIAADVLVIGSPLYNFSMPAALKAWIDQVIRLGRTVIPSEHDPKELLPALADRERHAVILVARGGTEMEPNEAMAHMNHLETSLTAALNFIGITRIHSIAVEGQESGGEVLASSITDAHRRVKTRVAELQATLC